MIRMRKLWYESNIVCIYRLKDLRRRHTKYPNIVNDTLDGISAEYDTSSGSLCFVATAYRPRLVVNAASALAQPSCPALRFHAKHRLVIDEGCDLAEQVLANQHILRPIILTA